MKPQEIWDKHLLSGALSYGKMSILLVKFFEDYDDSFLKDPFDWDVMKAELIRLNLRRCLDVTRKGVLVCNFGATPVLEFILCHSRTLASALAKRELHSSDYLLLKKYKWRKKLLTKRTRSKATDRSRYKCRPKLQGNISSDEVRLRARDIKDKHSWSTVK